MARDSCAKEIRMRWRWIVLTLAAAVLGGAAFNRLGGGEGGSFDKLGEADRKTFQERFERELWPLLSRNGKDGCVGCHNDRRRDTALRFTGKPDQDFRALLKEGFFLHDDPGNLLAR